MGRDVNISMTESFHMQVYPFLLTHLCLVSHKRTLANSVDPDQLLQNVGICS